MVAAPDLAAASAAVDVARSIVGEGARHLAATGEVDADQVVAYDLAHAAAAVENAAAVLEYGQRGGAEARIACAFVADAVYELATRTLWREDVWGIDAGALDAAAGFVRAYRAPDYLSELCGVQGPRHLDPDLVLVQDTFRRFAEEEVRPVAEEVHRHNLDIPERVIQGLAGIGAFGVSPSAARASTSRWSSPPRSCRGARSAWAGA
jgi:(2S)-methylsuccinyl-CoA dehydrogenase